MSDLNNRKVTNIKPIHLEDWRNKLVSTSYSPKYKNEILHQLKAIFKFGSQLFSISDPSTLLAPVKKDQYEEDSGIRTIITEEFDKLYSSLSETTEHDKYFKALIMAIWSTGMRRAEAKGIQWKDYNEKIFSITKSVTGKTKGDRSKISSTKTRSSIRKVNVSSICDQEIERLLSWVKNEYGYNDNWFMFGGPEPLVNSVIQYRFKAAIEESGISKIRLHDLRHSHATILINNGVPISAVSQRLGHSSINMTLKVYTHATKDAVNALISELPNLYSGHLLGTQDKETNKKALN